MSRTRPLALLCAALGALLALSLLAPLPDAMARQDAAAQSAAAQPGSPCDGTGHPWCDTSLSAQERAELVLAEMTDDEKYAFLAGDDPQGHTGRNAGIPRLDVPDMTQTDGPAGVRQGEATGLPAPIGLAATWDEKAARRYADVIGNEAKQKGNDILLGPNVNIMRLPEGGRTFEAYGEDPELTSRITVPFIEAIQAQGPLANVKHYVANNHEINRGTVNAVVPERALREIYLPAFEAAVKEANSGTVMLAYNAVNGEFMTANDELVDGVLKEEWGFPYFALSDYGFAVKSTTGAANGGLDLEMPFPIFYQPALLQEAVEAGQVPFATIEEHVVRQLRTMFAFGVFDRAPFPDDGEIDFDAHAVTAQQVAEEAFTLLRNADDALPLDLSGLDRIAVSGPVADEYKNGGGSSDVTPVRTVTPLQGIQERAGEEAEVVYDDGLDPTAAAATAATADVAIVVVADQQTEFLDRPCMGLNEPCTPNYGQQDDLISQVAAAQPNTIVVAEAAGPILMPWIEDVAAVLEVWYPGQEGGTSIARTLFGDVNPSGRLPVTFPVNEADAPLANDPESYPGVDNNAVYDEGVLVGYRHYDANEIEPLFPFGFGLSYTTFGYDDLRLEALDEGAARLSVAVTNTGERAGVAVPQLYLGMPDPSEDVQQPPRWLRDFDRVELAPGATARVTLELDARAFSYWNESADAWEIAPGCYQAMVGSSSRDLPLTAVLEQGGAACEGATPVTPTAPATPSPPAASPSPSPSSGPGSTAVERFGGADRIATAARISARRDAADTVVVARADQYPDALAGGPLAVHLDAPLLLTDSSGLSPAAGSEIDRLGASTAVLLGGTAALSPQVAADLRSHGLTVRRVSGANRFGTAEAIAGELPAGPEVLVAEGANADPARGFPDALSAGALASAEVRPVLLVTRDDLPEETARALSADVDATIVGGTAAVSGDVATAIDARSAEVRRLAGATRYDTSVAVADEALARGVTPDVTWLATGLDFPDGLTAGAAAGADGGVLLLVDGRDPEGSPVSLRWLSDHAGAIDALRIAGGRAAIDDEVEAEARRRVAP